MKSIYAANVHVHRHSPSVLTISTGYQHRQLIRNGERPTSLWFYAHSTHNYL